MEMIHVKVTGLSLSNMGFVVLLRGEHDPRTLPIFIGGAEAQSIALRMDHVEIPRPLTHDLFKNVLDCVECRLKRVVINDLAEGTFFAVLVLEHDGVEAEVDARPSDAVALAIRSSSPIFVVKKVMDQAGILIEENKAAAHEKAHGGKPSEPAEGGVRQLKSQLEQAISSERYEEAARLRDEIRKAEQEHRRN
jgi:bifunctional DNase/RNase